MSKLDVAKLLTEKTSRTNSTRLSELNNSAELNTDNPWMETFGTHLLFHALCSSEPIGCARPPIKINGLKRSVVLQIKIKMDDHYNR